MFYVCVHPVQQTHRHGFVAGWTHKQYTPTQADTHSLSLLPGAGFGTTQGLAFNLSVLQGISLHFGVQADTKIVRERGRNRLTDTEGKQRQRGEVTSV